MAAPAITGVGLAGRCPWKAGSRPRNSGSRDTSYISSGGETRQDPVHGPGARYKVPGARLQLVTQEDDSTVITMKINRSLLRFSDVAAYAYLAGFSTFAQAEQAFRDGRISERDWRVCLLARDWSGQRFTSGRQDRAYVRLGKEAFARRFVRGRRQIKAYIEKRFGYCRHIPEHMESLKHESST